MTNEHDEMPWSPAYFAEQMQEMQQASEEFSDKQKQLFSQMLSASRGANTDESSNGSNPFSQFMKAGNFDAFPNFGDFGNLGNFGPMGAAVFKTRVQSGGRISIPDAEREALDIDEGDIVQTFVVPIKRSRGDSNE
ncbi:hypothetical protein SAMN04487950_0732 [Halogranum rubrum]|uniref:SpoVT-AbrB domain-containing protein n=1 Tax=Halogranum rubrum TaxID=553466 RepID=A0A1I4BSY1_9EURY|nr:AbrB/MazE/SpoVT family DNA-binding domain-containing protein [Halogranum rubrum]SFK71500.1 hypothetical protein SAMN04487950_0732 [Halogranum rubrum]